MELDRQEFVERLHRSHKIRCDNQNCMIGKGVYHILDIYDGVQVAVKYFKRDRIKEWVYRFYSEAALWVLFQNEQIKLIR